MVDNVGRKVALILALLLGSIALLIGKPLLTGSPPFPLGLDIAGGERRVYKFDFEEARRSGAIGADESTAEILDQQIAIIRERLDPDGTKEAVIRPLGADRIEVSVPSTSKRGATAVSTLLAAVQAETTIPFTLELDGEESSLLGFENVESSIRVDGEEMKYSRRDGNKLLVIQRGEGGAKVEHPAGARVTLIASDEIKAAVENLGDLRFYAVATNDDFRPSGLDETTARNSLRTWLDNPAHANAPIKLYNQLPRDQGGPPAGIAFFPSPRDGLGPNGELSYVACLLPKSEAEAFAGGDLAQVTPTSDSKGFPAVGFEMAPNKRIQFGRFTQNLIDRQMAIVINDEVVSAPVVNSGLWGSAYIEGRFGLAERDALIRILRSGSLKVRPQLEAAETVGASIGDDYVRKNVFAGLTVLGMIIAFLCFYYRSLGVLASVSMLINLTLLMGAMVVLNGTLTLAGIGGIVLTVGMAVDASILIFERMWEEQEKGRKPLQAAKDGFANAMSAIVDGNITTLITAIILYNVGTGTIRGFAVTLSLGIVSTMFSALVVLRVLVHLKLQKGVERWDMRRMLQRTNIKFMDKRRIVIPISLLIIVAGCVGFLLEDEQKKLGIDFLGGATAKVRTEEPMDKGAFEALVKQGGGTLVSADVVDLPNSRDDQGRAREFRITVKGAMEGESGDAQQRFAQDIATALAGVIQKGPIELDARVEESTNKVTAALYFEGSHPTADIEKGLVAAGLEAPQLQARGGRGDVLLATGTAPLALSANALRSAIADQFDGDLTDSNGRQIKLAEPIPETSIVGAQVVGELRDSALLALFFSCLAVLLYIRVRFAEYSYGWGALVADLHDVLFTLAAVAFLIIAPWIRVELNLTMIAAFLTILGYSLNDSIIIFDRIRENLPRVKGSLYEICDLSINQTLARTIITSGTTIIASLVILIFNFGTGNALEGFAFALTFGVIVGTYSTIYIAAPVFVWFETRHRAKLALEAKAATPRTPQGAAS
jgi:SecD/SecF fusion protein